MNTFITTGVRVRTNGEQAIYKTKHGFAVQLGLRSESLEALANGSIGYQRCYTTAFVSSKEEVSAVSEVGSPVKGYMHRLPVTLADGSTFNKNYLVHYDPKDCEIINGVIFDAKGNEVTAKAWEADKAFYATVTPTTVEAEATTV